MAKNIIAMPKIPFEIRVLWKESKYRDVYKTLN
jgi:hypothetical protein